LRGSGDGGVHRQARGNTLGGGAHGVERAEGIAHALLRPVMPEISGRRLW
jgi:hypothetical protein